MILLSILPITTLLVCLIIIKLPVAKSGGVSLALTLIIAIFAFGMDFFGLSVAVGKALSLALFVSLIVWCALLFYHLADDFKAIDVICKNLVLHIDDHFVDFLMLAWLFSGLLQGIAGFGIPIVIITPILITLGYDKTKSLAAALIGHSWAVTFGSMGAAFYIIQMITGVPHDQLGIPMWVFNTSAHLLTGIGVCWLYSGLKGIKKGIPYVLPVSFAMALTQFLAIYFGLYPLATLLTALTGLIVMFALYKMRATKKENRERHIAELTLFQALGPYTLIFGLSILFQFLPSALRNISISFSFAGSETSLGHIVEVETGYSAIRLFGHPSVILLFAAASSIFIYKSAGIWDMAVFRTSVNKTVKKGIPATITLLALGTMSLIMMDSGMTQALAYGVVDIVGGAYPLVAPFFGVLASFLTGNNTNANVLFGSFQYTIAQRLEVSGAVMSAAQSLSASVGVSIGPTLVLMGALSGKICGQESVVYKKLLPIVLLIALVMGVINFILV